MFKACLRYILRPHLKIKHKHTHTHTHGEGGAGNVAQWPSTHKALGLFPPVGKTSKNKSFCGCLASSQLCSASQHLWHTKESGHSLGPTVSLWTTLAREHWTSTGHKPVFLFLSMRLCEGQPSLPSQL